MMMPLPKTLLFTATILGSSIAIAYCQEHSHTHRELYVKSTPTQQCPQYHQCHTLLSYLQNGTASFTSNTTLHFLPGNHSAAVPQPMTLVISNISNLALVGPEVGPDEPPVAHIWCNYTMQFQFINASNVSLKGLEIRECGVYNSLTQQSLYSHDIIVSEIPSAVLFESVDSIALENLHIMYSHGFGLVVWNSFGYVSVYNSNLSYNGRKNFSTNVGIGGNALFYYNTDTLPTGLTDLQVISSIFGYGYGSGDNYFQWFAEHSEISGGLSIVVDSKPGRSDITIAVSDSIFHNNQAASGANMVVSVYGSSQQLSGVYVYLSILNSSFINGTALTYGGGLYIGLIDKSAIGVYGIAGSNFSWNSAGWSGGGLYVHASDSDYLPSPSVMNISNTTFSLNRAEEFGGGVSIHLLYGSTIGVCNIAGSIFSWNSAGWSGGGLYVSGSGLMTLSMNISNATFSLNRAEKFGGGVSIDLLYGSTIGVCNIAGSIFSWNSADWSGGGLYVSVSGSDYLMPRLVMNIINTTFSMNRAEEDGGGTYIEVVNTVLISSSVFSQNVAGREGGGMYVDTKLKISIHNCLIEDNTAAESGGGLLAMIVSMNIHHSTFCRNNASGGGALYISLHTNINNYWESKIFVVHCRILENYAIAGAGLNIIHSEGYQRYFTIFLNETNISGNRADMMPAIVARSVYNRPDSGIVLIFDSMYIYNNTVVNLQYGSAVVKLENVVIELISGTRFIDNTGSSIAANNSHISLQGHVEFSGNRAYAGAAILLDCSYSDRPSFLTLLPNTTVTITNNTALYYGGGIAVSPVCNYSDYCFIQLPYLTGYNTSEELNTVVFFEGNEAHTAGNSIYGPPLSHCKMMDGRLGEEDVLLALSSVTNSCFSDQVVLAQAYSICFCGVDDKTQLTCSTELERAVRPGAEFSVSALITGQLNDNSSGASRATLVAFEDSDSQLGKLQHIQELRRSCDHLNYSVMTTAETAQIELQTEVAPNAPHSFINLTILKCPIAFSFNARKRKCDCNEYLTTKTSQITCDITTEMIEVPENFWIGNLSNNRLGVHQHCPLDYCKPEPHSIDLSNQHQQCTSNRSGVLCGACNSGFSLALGTARCLDNCSHYYLFLIIPFALAGVAIVFILLKCNLTVSMGTTNALVFYANIVHTNHTIFFPQSNISIITRFLAVFIAWLNLDLGIETCLYRGMTAYANTWLQFVFPVYIWLLVLIIIYSSRYSVTASKLIGRNAVSVLATLFLLSYAKLLHTIIAVISPISIDDEEGKYHLLWLMDGNVSYFSAPHAVLFIIALVAVLLYIVPLTLLTLLAPCLQARTNHRMMRWVVRIKPLLDAYQGPYKDKYRYWTGVMFIQRIVLFTAFAANTSGNPNINLFAIIVCIIFAYVYQIYKGRLYKNRLNWFLEGLYSLNLVIFSLAVLSLKGSQRSKEYLACVMVGSVFIVFCLTVIWHIDYQTTVISRAMKKIKDHLGNQRRRQAESPQEATDPPPPSRQPLPTVTVIDMKELREPLLTDN